MSRETKKFSSIIRSLSEYRTRENAELTLINFIFENSIELTGQDIHSIGGAVSGLSDSLERHYKNGIKCLIEGLELYLKANKSFVPNDYIFKFFNMIDGACETYNVPVPELTKSFLSTHIKSVALGSFEQLKSASSISNLISVFTSFGRAVRRYTFLDLLFIMFNLNLPVSIEELSSITKLYDQATHNGSGLGIWNIQIQSTKKLHAVYRSASWNQIELLYNICTRLNPNKPADTASLVASIEFLTAVTLTKIFDIIGDNVAQLDLFLPVIRTDEILKKALIKTYISRFPGKIAFWFPQEIDEWSDLDFEEAVIFLALTVKESEKIALIEKLKGHREFWAKHITSETRFQEITDILYPQWRPNGTKIYSLLYSTLTVEILQHLFGLKDPNSTNEPLYSEASLKLLSFWKKENKNIEEACEQSARMYELSP